MERVDKVIGFTLTLVVMDDEKKVGFILSDEHAEKFKSSGWKVQKIYVRNFLDVDTLMDEYRKKGYEIRQLGFTMGKVQ